MNKTFLSVSLALGCFACSARQTREPRLWRLLDPGTFDPAALPTPPDYTAASGWLAHPDTDDDADVALPTLPATDPSGAGAAVFYLHPTTHLARAWNGPIDEAAYREASARGGTLIQASAFNGSAAVYAPAYRQAHGRSFTHPTPDGDLARDVAFGDVSAAFDVFLSELGERPFLVASHSQGSVMAARLLRERVASTPLAERLVAWEAGQLE